MAAATVAGVIGWSIYVNSTSGLNSNDAFFLFCMALMVAIAAINSYWLRQPWGSPTVLSLFAAASIIVALMFGRFYSLIVLENLKHAPPDQMTAITSKSSTDKGYVLMTGERGILIYFPEGDRLSFQKIDEIQKIEWQR